MRARSHRVVHRRDVRPPVRWLVLGAGIALALALNLTTPRASRAGSLEDFLTEIGSPHKIGGSDSQLIVDKLEEKQLLTEAEWQDLKNQIEQERAFSVTVGGRVQPRAILYSGSDHVEGVPGDPDLRPGFQLRSARLNAGGQVYWPWLRYYVQLDMVSRIDPTEFKTELIDAKIDLVDVIPFHTIRLGLSKPAFARQQLVSSSKLQFQEPSIAVQELERLFLDREIGIGLFGRIPVLDEALLIKYGVGVYNGNGKQGITGDLNEGKMVAARGQVDLFRDLGRDEGDLDAGNFGASVGGGYFYNRDVAATPQGFTFDAEMRWMGASVTGGYLQVKFEPDLEAGIELPDFATSFRTEGWYAQAGFMVVPHLFELVGRYESYDSNSEIEDNGDVSSYTVGANAYLVDHNLKLSLDYVGRLEDAGADLANDGLTLEVLLVF